MNLTIWICCFMPLIILYFMNKKIKNYVTWQRIKNKKKRKDRELMIELIKKFIDKDCIISTINSKHFGIIKEVSDAGVLIESEDCSEIINAEFILSVKEYPLNKNGKKKMFV